MCEGPRHPSVWETCDIGDEGGREACSSACAVPSAGSPRTKMQSDRTRRGRVFCRSAGAVHNAGSPRSQLPEVCIRCRVECQERDFEDNKHILRRDTHTQHTLALSHTRKKHGSFWLSLSFTFFQKCSKTRTLLARVCVTKRHDRPAGNTTRCGALCSFSKHDKFNIKRAGNRFGSEKKK